MKLSYTHSVAKDVLTRYLEHNWEMLERPLIQFDLECDDVRV